MMTTKILRSTSLVAAGALLLSACGGEVPPTSFPGLTVEGGEAYLSSNLHVYKFDPRSGSLAWMFPAATTSDEGPRGPFAGPPLRFGDLVIVGETVDPGGRPHHTLYALSVLDGAERWRFSGGQREYVDGVSSDGTLIFAPNGDHTLYALDPAQIENGEPRVAWKFTAKNKLWSRPLVANGKVYQASLDRNLYALDAATGRLLWTFSAGASIAARPAILDGVLFFGSFDQHVYAVNADTGAQVWRSERLSGWVWCDPLIADGSVLVGDVKGGFYALDARDGRVQWRSQVGGAIRAQPVVVGDSIYVVASDTYLYRLDHRPTPDANGYVSPARVLENGLVRRLFSTPVYVGDALLVPLFDGDVKLIAVNLETRQKKFEFPSRPAGQ
jgi:outer membrane protein assembly factor BamB